MYAYYGYNKYGLKLIVLSAAIDSILSYKNFLTNLNSD